jgi:hypothetical protein
MANSDAVVQGGTLVPNSGMDAPRTLRELAEAVLRTPPRQNYRLAAHEQNLLADPILTDLNDRFAILLGQLHYLTPHTGLLADCEREKQKRIVYLMCEISRDFIVRAWPPNYLVCDQVQNAIRLFKEAVALVQSEDALVLEFRENIRKRAQELDEALGDLERSKK